MLKNVKNNYYLLSLFAGFLYALGFPSFIGAPILPLTIIGSYLYLRSLFAQKKLKENIYSLLFFSVGFNLTGFYWISDTIQEFGNLPYSLSLILSLFFSVIIVPHLWVFLFAKRYLQKDKRLPLAYQPLILAFLLAAFESFIPALFPTSIGQIYIQYPKIVSLAHLGGIPLYSFITYWIILSLVQKSKSRSIIIACSIFIIASFVFRIDPNNNKNEKALNVRMVQANIGNFMKVSSETGNRNSMDQIFKRYYNLSTEEHPGFNPDLIVWPETAYPHSQYTDIPVDQREGPELIRVLIDSMQTPMLIGGYTRNSNSFSSFESDYNSAFYFNRKGILEQYYHKMVLIPFGETLPFPTVIKKELSKTITNVSYFARGDSFSQFKLDNGMTFITPICYELLKPRFLRNFLSAQDNETSFMLNLTNDSWYGDTAEPEQHLFLSRWRAVEFNIPILRSTNTGITTIINSDGSLGPRLGIGEKDRLDLKVLVRNRTATIYQCLGFLFTFFFFVLCLIMLWLENRPLKGRVT